MQSSDDVANLSQRDFALLSRSLYFSLPHLHKWQISTFRRLRKLGESRLGAEYQEFLVGGERVLRKEI